MAHDAFPTKYRPKLLTEMVGQPIATSILGASLAQDKFTRSILLSGVYSSGKTTLARIIARYVNCLNRKPDGSPCMTCRSCEAMEGDKHPDVMEINAAEARGIDNVREVIEYANLSPMYKYRVFIFDEVQRLTDAAFPALLKPIEEPPAKSIFILCTTNRERIPNTIISRCADIQLKKVTAEDCALRLQQVCDAEGIKQIAPENLLAIAKAVDGHPRSALSLLEQIVMYIQSQGQMPNLQDMIPKYVADVLRASPEGLAMRFIYALLSEDFQNTLKLISSVETAEPFLQKTIQMLQQITYEIFAPGKLADKHYQRYFDDVMKLPLIEKHMDKVLPALVSILGDMLEAYSKARSYSYEDRALLDYYTLKATLTLTKITAG